MSGWKAFADWMAYTHLDDGVGLTRTFVLAYKITDDAGEHWTARFNRFKAKNMDALAGAARTFRVAMPELVEALDLDLERTVFIPALGSGETEANPTSFVATLARHSAESSEGRFEIGALSKRAHRPIHGIYNAADRGAELDTAAYIGTRLKGIRTALVFDDFVTRGGTLSRIAQALQAKNPNLAVYGVALGKTDRRAYWGALSNDHVPQRWDRLWAGGEQRYIARQAGARE